MCDDVCNSHDNSVLHSIDITRRNLMLITLKGSKGLVIFVLLSCWSIVNNIILCFLILNNVKS